MGEKKVNCAVGYCISAKAHHPLTVIRQGQAIRQTFPTKCLSIRKVER